MKEKERGTDNRSNVTFRINKIAKLYVFYTKETIENRIHTMQKNCEAVLIKLLYNKSNFKKSENLLFNKKGHETKAGKYI